MNLHHVYLFHQVFQAPAPSGIPSTCLSVQTWFKSNFEISNLLKLKYSTIRSYITRFLLRTQRENDEIFGQIWPRKWIKAFVQLSLQYSIYTTKYFWVCNSMSFYRSQDSFRISQSIVKLFIQWKKKKKKLQKTLWNKICRF